MHYHFGSACFHHSFRSVSMSRKNRTTVETTTAQVEAPVVETPVEVVEQPTQQVTGGDVLAALAPEPTMSQLLAEYAYPSTTRKAHAHNGGGNRYNWSGISAAALLRYLGSKGHNVAACRKVMAYCSITCSEATIKTQRQLGKQGKGCALPTLTEEQVKAIEAAAA
jgi:hypothetical protein